MPLFQRVAKKEEEPEMICWQDGYHRSFEPAPRASAIDYSYPGSRKGLAAKRIGGAIAIALALHFTGVTEIIAEKITQVNGSQYAPVTSQAPTARP